ncbi:MAG: hypothetical protein H6720_08505 [Sandaracinus sp.]|nr:hypothetical protein [Sandaracinus sp.]
MTAVASGTDVADEPAATPKLFAPEGPWLFSRRTDLLAFGGSALLAFVLLGIGALLGIAESDTPDALWIVCVLGLDVAHVWSTLYRVYFDGEELRRHPLLYLAVPLACYATGVTLYAMDGPLFWSVLAYLAVFHFVRQQVGWVRIYARRERASDLDRHLDVGATYLATLWPIVWWHAHLPRAFAWLLEGDFVTGVSGEVARWTFPLYVGVLGAWTFRQLWRLVRGPAPSPGKLVVVATTFATWLVGIVLIDGDFAFTVTNVIVHAVPYFVLTHRYVRVRASQRPSSWLARLLRGGPVVFLGVVVVLAFGEELFWDRYVWHERTWLFGEGSTLTQTALCLVVPLLALPQATHYVLDGFVWRASRSSLLR